MDAVFMSIITELFKDYAIRTERQLTAAMGSAYVEGEQMASGALRIPINWDLVREEALTYSKEYGEMLAKQGGSVINGEFVPWMANSTEDARSQVAKIIEQGIAEGKPTGVLERVKGGYPKGTIASDLEKYFQGRRSHAVMVARTETARVQNTAALNRYQERGLSHVRVKDGMHSNSCDACSALNNQVWTVAEAQARQLEHPNCIRAFAPVPRSESEGL